MRYPGNPHANARTALFPAAILMALAGLLPFAPGVAQEREPMSGQEVYTRFCGSCHNTGIEEAPRIGAVEEWSDRIAAGRETMYENAIEGLRGMPPRGGIAALFDQEVRDAVDFMVQSSGGWPDEE